VENMSVEMKLKKERRMQSSMPTSMINISCM